MEVYKVWVDPVDGMRHVMRHVMVCNGMGRV